MSKKTKLVQTWVSKETYDKLREIAEIEQRSMASLLRMLISTGIALRDDDK